MGSRQTVGVLTVILDNKPFDDVSADDILALIPEVAENRRLDYKRSLPENNEKSIRSFLNDVCALANSAGGWLIYGIDEERDEDGSKTGIPCEVCGVGEVNEDEAIRDWQQRITQAIEPRLIGHRVDFINGFEDGKKVMVVFVQKSLFAPHRTNYKGVKEFYLRHDRFNMPMEMTEIRHGFVEAKQVPQKIDEFRRLRVMQILAGETPIEVLTEPPVFVCHLIPLSSFAEDAAVDITRITGQNPMRVMGSSVGSGRLNADGYLYSSVRGADYARAYVQVYRNGTIEMVSTERDIVRGMSGGIPLLPSQWQEQEFIAFVGAAIDLLKYLGVQPPIYIGLSLLRVKGVAMALPQNRFFDQGQLIDKDKLIIPTVTSETMDEPVDRLLHPAFNAIWQASGMPKSIYYNEDGDWAPSR